MGCSPRGHRESDTTQRLTQHTACPSFCTGSSAPSELILRTKGPLMEEKENSAVAHHALVSELQQKEAVTVITDGSPVSALTH